MKMTDLLLKKRNGGVLTREEIEFFVAGVTDGSIPDYQISALLMAIYFQGLNAQETACLTLSMANSGDTVDLSNVGGITVDKHSTGGVGDKTTLIVAPLAAALGCKVAKMSGRGLGFTGGTIDKLESIKGFQTSLSLSAFLHQVQEIGLCVVGQSGNFTPADKKLYALRDVTATVENHSLIAASIMSKKISAGAGRIVLDVKTGKGAFMKTLEEAKALAQEMVTIGHETGRKTVALCTNMDVPLGMAVGNALEVEEAIRTLKNEGPQQLTDLCVAIAAQMVSLCFGTDIETCEAECRRALQDGRAWEKFRQMVAAQGGDLWMIDHPETFLEAAQTEVYRAPCSGYLSEIDSMKVGEASMILGAGREKKEDAIDPAAGVLLRALVGQKVECGQVLAQLQTNGAREKIEAALPKLAAAFCISADPPAQQPLIHCIVKK